MKELGHWAPTVFFNLNLGAITKFTFFAIRDEESCSRTGFLEQHKVESGILSKPTSIIVFICRPLVVPCVLN